LTELTTRQLVIDYPKLLFLSSLMTNLDCKELTPQARNTLHQTGRRSTWVTAPTDNLA
jgi:hypothetical protein